VVVVSDDLYNRMAAPQVDAIAAAAVSSGQAGSATAVFDAVMPDVANRVRQYIASNPKNRLSSTDSSVPPELKSTTVWLVLQELMARLAIALELRPDQLRMIETAESDLNKLRNIQPPWLLISAPDDPEAEPSMQVGPNATVVRSSCRQFTQHSLHAL
jgi:hypothetical protein